MDRYHVSEIKYNAPGGFRCILSARYNTLSLVDCSSNTSCAKQKVLRVFFIYRAWCMEAIRTQTRKGITGS